MFLRLIKEVPTTIFFFFLSGRRVSWAVSNQSVLRANKSKSLFSLGRKQSFQMQSYWCTAWTVFKSFLFPSSPLSSILTKYSPFLLFCFPMFSALSCFFITHFIEQYSNNVLYVCFNSVQHLFLMPKCFPDRTAEFNFWSELIFPSFLRPSHYFLYLISSVFITIPCYFLTYFKIKPPIYFVFEVVYFIH